MLSDYDSSSEAMKVVADAPHVKPIAVSADLRAMLGASRELYEQSAGAFDITIGPLSKIWRRARRQRQLPADAALDAAQTSVGGEAIELTADGVRLRKPGMRLDFGGNRERSRGRRSTAGAKGQGLPPGVGPRQRRHRRGRRAAGTAAGRSRSRR